ncbi:uncharacterized protein LOC107606584 [Arachis ipaensis]|uniref:uncharacterized protein LOC107606584 n=1 Tax=Arachis ipaensis TaxID=130454 RepID=UPI0007AF599C|nr:uncharacterized protein LOC107606584 [Arachis ipaensis]
MFATSLGDSGLFDLKTIRRRFSWYRRVKNYVDVAKKLDRVCINSNWLSIFLEACAEVLNRLQSDHCPILVRCKGRPQPKENRPFRFVATWDTHPGYRDIVNQSWWFEQTSIRMDPLWHGACCDSWLRSSVDCALKSLAAQVVADGYQSVSAVYIKKVNVSVRLWDFWEVG